MANLLVSSRRCVWKKSGGPLHRKSFLMHYKPINEIVQECYSNLDSRGCTGFHRCICVSPFCKLRIPSKGLPSDPYMRSLGRLGIKPDIRISQPGLPEKELGTQTTSRYSTCRRNGVCYGEAEGCPHGHRKGKALNRILGYSAQRAGRTARASTFHLCTRFVFLFSTIYGCRLVTLIQCLHQR